MLRFANGHPLRQKALPFHAKNAYGTKEGAQRGSIGCHSAIALEGLLVSIGGALRLLAGWQRPPGLGSGCTSIRLCLSTRSRPFPAWFSAVE